MAGVGENLSVRSSDSRQRDPEPGLLGRIPRFELPHDPIFSSGGVGSPFADSRSVVLVRHSLGGPPRLLVPTDRE